MKILITGGAGFIGSAVVRHLLAESEHEIVNVDSLTYAGNLESIPNAESNSRYAFEQVNICDTGSIELILAKHRPDAVMHLAAESHVDRSIDGPADFVQTNLVGTYVLLDRVLAYWNSLEKVQRDSFRFHHISTDEVYGDLGNTEELFKENTPYSPSSPYSATKAGSDHLVRAWHRTYGLPVLITNCSNNYGPYHFPEKLIPHIILNALAGKPLPVYGDGSQIRDWLYVEDHARALSRVLTEGKVGETYNIGGHNEKTNLQVVEAICELLDELSPSNELSSYKTLITFVKDRPGHDIRYAIDATKIAYDLSWYPQESFETGLKKTVIWYLDNAHWWERVLSGEYSLGRLGEG